MLAVLQFDSSVPLVKRMVAGGRLDPVERYRSAVTQKPSVPAPRIERMRQLVA